MQGRLEGRVVVVTGGAGGIGLAITKRVAREGAAVGILDINREAGEQAAGLLRSQGGKYAAACADVAHAIAVQEAFEVIEPTLGPIDGVVNNAGIAAFGSAHDKDAKAWERVIGRKRRRRFPHSKGVASRNDEKSARLYRKHRFYRWNCRDSDYGGLLRCKRGRHKPHAPDGGGRAQ